MKKGKTKKMMDSNIKNKLGNILHFFLSSFTVMFTSVIVSVGAFIAIAVAGNLTSGDWTIGTQSLTVNFPPLILIPVGAAPSFQNFLI